MNEGKYSVVRACAIALLAGVVLQANKVSAGNGLVIDWRTVPSGEIIQANGDPFDTAYLFVTLVGLDAAQRATSKDQEIPLAPPTVIRPTVHAFAIASNGGRRRVFSTGEFTVMVEPHEDDEAQAEFTAKLAAFCATLKEARS